MRAYLERITPQHDSSIQGTLVSADCFPAPWHFHPEFELTFIRGGWGARYVGDKLEPFGPGDLVLVGPNLPHRWESRAHKGALAEATVLQWPADLIPSGLELVAIQKMLSDARRGLVFETENTQPIAKKMRLLLVDRGLNRFLRLVELLGALSELPCRSISDDHYEYDRGEESHSRLNMTLGFVREQFGGKVTLAQVAELTGLSSQQFARFFLRVMNRPFFEYLNEYRIHIACQRLTQTTAPVAQIAAECGFPSMPFFHKQFKKFHPLTPLQYRKRYSTANA